ncbi:MAG: tetratricopeptide repeat protein [Chloroflexi bacterium]|nr:tetratricopeptide repeat protein [Chloroflexota bacterium]
MELTLRFSKPGNVLVLVNGQDSHSFALSNIVPNKNVSKFGGALYAALFPENSKAHQTLQLETQRILLVLLDEELEAVPWEYVHGPDGFLILDLAFVRGVPADKRIAAPDLSAGLHILAVPSNPLHEDIVPLDIEGEWNRLETSIRQLKHQGTLERVRPPTIENLQLQGLAGMRGRIVHFMGHGGISDDGAVLIFEKEAGTPDSVTAKEFHRRVKDSVFLVSLNACVTADPGETEFANLARALVMRGAPYALGTRFPIPDEAAKTLSQIFYGNLSRGETVEASLLQARNSLAKLGIPELVGIPVLYTALSEPAPGFQNTQGGPQILDPRQPSMYIDSALPKAPGRFEGRVGALAALGGWLSGDKRPRLVTIHGGGGLGKTALAREAVERFAHAFPGGVWAAALVSLPTRAEFVRGLAQFLGVAVEGLDDPAEIERQALDRLGRQRTLLAVDNAETLLEGVEAGDEDAIDLAAFLREALPGTKAHLLVTSRYTLGWPGEEGLSLGGLREAEGARLLWNGMPQRKGEVSTKQAEDFSRLLGGHPLSLRLLGSAFNAAAELDFAAFVAEHEHHLRAAADKYKGEDDRHRTLYAAIETSVAHLGAEEKKTLGGLHLFRTAFPPEAAAWMLDEGEHREGEGSPVFGQLERLWRRGFLLRETRTVRDGDVLMYRLLPAVRVYAEDVLAGEHNPAGLRTRYGQALHRVLRGIYAGHGKSMGLVHIAQQSWADLEQGWEHLEGLERADYLNRWGWVAGRLGDNRLGLVRLEQALELVQGLDQLLENDILNNLALVYQATGQMAKALALYEQALPIRREVGDRAGEAVTLNNLAGVYDATGQMAKALALYEQALPIQREVGDRAGEAATLNNLAGVYQATGQMAKALALYEQALPITREVGDRAGEAAMLDNMAMLLYMQLERPEEAIQFKQRAIRVLEETGLEYDAGGDSLDTYRQTLGRMQAGERLGGGGRASGLDGKTLNTLRANTVAALTAAPERKDEWETTLRQALSQAQSGNDTPTAELFETLLALLAGEAASLAEGHPHAGVLEQVKQAVAAYDPEEMERLRPVLEAVQAYLSAEDWTATQEMVKQHQKALLTDAAEGVLAALAQQAEQAGNSQAVEMLALHLGLVRACRAKGINAAFEELERGRRAGAAAEDEEFIARAAAGLRGGPEEKQALFNELQGMTGRGEEFGKLAAALRLAVFSKEDELDGLGKDLDERHARLWLAIRARVKEQNDGEEKET